ncbi:MAG: soluble lytic murein transglycosylase [Paraglaciecola sp.]|jgi:soluble lytic murein transglycosylase
MLLSLLTLINFLAYATEVVSLAEQKLQYQRKIFAKAESLASRPSSPQYQQLLSELADYPLKPYVELKALMSDVNMQNSELIEQFLQRYKGTPLDNSLRKKWLAYLAKEDQQVLFLKYYLDVGDTALACKKIEYSLKNPELHAAALQDITPLWIVGQSQPQECDQIFRLWQQAGKLTQDMVWQRLVLAASEGKHTLIPYLQQLLVKDKRYLADLWLKVRRDASYVSRASQFPGKNPQLETQILVYGLKRLAWSQADLALKSWFALEKRFAFSDAQQRSIAERFALALAVGDHPQADEWLDKANTPLQGKALFRWHLAHVLRKGNWQHALSLLEFAPSEITQDNAFQYWLGRTYQQLNATELANQTFSKLAHQRHYYGFMASGQLDQEPQLQDIALNFSPQEMLLIANMPQAKRAYEFLQLKRDISARREWYDLQKQLTNQQSLTAAVIADSWKWHDQAIFTFARVGYLDDLNRRFPMGYDDTLLSSAKKYQLDPAWAFAIVRRESSFMADANSSAGARGLMQLMPGTARYLAKKKILNNSLYNPQQNVEYGTQYMRYLLDKMDNNPVLATASYNAGWQKVKDWLPKQKKVPMDIWVETIPYKETRNYVKAVMAYKQIYTQRLGQSGRLFNELANMEIAPDKR